MSTSWRLSVPISETPTTSDCAFGVIHTTCPLSQHAAIAMYDEDMAATDGAELYVSAYVRLLCAA